MFGSGKTGYSSGDSDWKTPATYLPRPSFFFQVLSVDEKVEKEQRGGEAFTAAK